MPSDLADRLRRHLQRHYATQSALVTTVWESGGEGLYRIGGTRFARVFGTSRPLERVEGDGAVLEFAERHGVPAERLVRSADGERATVLDGHGVLVTTLVAGTALALDSETLRRLGDAAGRVAALPHGDDPLLDRTAGSLPAEDLAAARSSLSGVARSPDAERLAAAVEATGDCSDLPHGFVHPDVHPANALRTADGTVALVDWTGAGRGPRIAMLGWLLYSAATNARDRGDPDLSRLGPVIDGYRRHHVPAPDELDRLPDAVRFRPLALAVRELETSRPSPWPFDEQVVTSVADEARRLLR